MSRFSRINASDESGVTLVLVAILIVALFGMLTLVVDVGGLLVKRRSMVAAADSAALAAAQSCAAGRDTVLPSGQKAGDPEVEADQFANQNATQLNSSSTNILPFPQTVGCPPVTSASVTGSGHVTVSYVAPQEIFFGEVIGTGSSTDVNGKATAAWGALASGNPLPIVLEAGQLQGPCKIPDPSSVGQECAFWYNNNDLGSSQWGFMNLDQWNVSTNASCPNAGSGSNGRGGWIVSGYPTQLPLNGTPPGTSPTYVCADSGHSQNDWMTLASQEGQIKLFPVNDCAGQIPACPTSKPDKYDIIGFSSLLVEHVYKGNDPSAIGSFGATGTCALTPPNMGTGYTQTLTSILSSTPNTSGCPTSSPPVSGITNVMLTYGQGAGRTTITCGTTGPCLYDAPSGVLTWTGAAQSNAKITFDWAFSNTAGACGTHPSDPNAICLVTVYKGFITSNGTIGGGTNFGAIGLRLCDLSIVGSCPE